jgi:hypothetical protein
MKAHKWFGLTLITGALLGLLAGPPLLAQATSEPESALSDQPIAAPAVALSQRKPSSQRPAPPHSPHLVPGNPVLTPISNTHTAPNTTTVSISYDEPIDPVTVSTATFAVHAAQTGLLTETYSVIGGAISLTPPDLFKPGELVQVSATTGTLNLSGEGPISPTVWSFRVATGGGYGHFTGTLQTFPFSDTTALALGDVDADGDLDALVAHWIGYGNEVWLNDGSGVFTDSGQSLGTIGSLSTALGDLDGDGDLDAFIGNANTGDGDVDQIWFNDGRGVFIQSSQDLRSSSSGGLALGDLDGDGDLDAFVGQLFGANQVWLNDGTGVFTDSNQALGGSSSYAVALGDLDGDSDLDAFVANGGVFNDGPNHVWLNDGRGVFSNPYPGLGGSGSTAVDLGDLDGDGDLDALVANQEGQANHVWLNDGRGRFSQGDRPLWGGDSWDARLGDLDGDGDLDAFVANANLYAYEGEANRVWLNDGNGSFSPTAQHLGLSASLAVDLGDLDGDGDLDAFVANADPLVHFTGEGDPDQVWLNTPAVTSPQLYLPLVMNGGSPYFQVSSVRQLTPCENQGKHHIFVHVIDAAGNGLNGVPVLICWGPAYFDCAHMITEEKWRGNGWVEFAMFKGTYSVQIEGARSQVASGITPDFAVDEICEDTGSIGNSRFHVSFEVTFTRDR